MERLTTPNIIASTRRGIGAAIIVAGAAIMVALGLFLSAGVGHIWWEVVTLGIVEGLTEFLPISSTAHLLITADLLHFPDSIGGTFEIFIQVGAILAVVLYYARDLAAQARALPGSPPARRFWLGILIAFVPAALVGLALRKWIKAVLFASPEIIAASLIAGGIVLIAVELLLRRAARTSDVEQISFGQALGVGVAQILALIPGVSRSATSIVGGMLGGLDRRTATAFSFYLAIPTLGAATAVDLLGSLAQVSSGDLARLAVGTLVAFVVAWLSIGWLLRYVAQHSFVAFGVYRIVAGMIVLTLLASGRL
jgi:undecaprenyl-diphosphatase